MDVTDRIRTERPVTRRSPWPGHFSGGAAVPPWLKAKSRIRVLSVRSLTLPGRLVAAHRRNSRAAGATLASILLTPAGRGFSPGAGPALRGRRLGRLSVSPSRRRWPAVIACIRLLGSLIQINAIARLSPRIAGLH
jgi:hypothetical protein